MLAFWVLSCCWVLSKCSAKATNAVISVASHSSLCFLIKQLSSGPSPFINRALNAISVPTGNTPCCTLSPECFTMILSKFCNLKLVHPFFVHKIGWWTNQFFCGKMLEIEFKRFSAIFLAAFDPSPEELLEGCLISSSGLSHSPAAIHLQVSPTPVSCEQIGKCQEVLDSKLLGGF